MKILLLLIFLSISFAYDPGVNVGEMLSIGGLLKVIDEETGYLFIPIISISIFLATMSVVSKYQKKGNLFIPSLITMIFTYGFMVASNSTNPYGNLILVISAIITIISFGMKINENFGD